MSEVMTPMSFEQLVEWVLQEKKKRGTVFGQHHAYRADGTHNRTMFGRTLETPIGPAAGPHTQIHRILWQPTMPAVVSLN